MPRTLAEIAIEAGLVSRAEVARAARAAEGRGVPLVVGLVRDLGLDELALLGAIRKQSRVTALDPGTVRPDPEALRLVPRDLCRRHRVLPIAVGIDRSGARQVRLAMADPTDAAALAEVEHAVGGELEVVLLPLSAIDELIDHGYRGMNTQIFDRNVGRPRRPFGDGMHVGTQPHARRDAGDDTAITPSTVPFHAIADEADVGLRLRALVRLLEAKGVLAEGEHEEAVLALMRGGGDVPEAADATRETSIGGEARDDD